MIRQYRPALITIAAAVALTTAACGGDDTPQESTSASTSASAAPTTSTSRAVQPGTGNGAVQPGTGMTPSVQPGVSTQPASIGPAQTITTSDGTAIVTAYTPSLYIDGDNGKRALLVPVTIDIESGTLEANSSVWMARTQSGIEMNGSTLNSIPTAVGRGNLTGRIEGDIFIPGDRSGENYLTDTVSITDIILTTPNASSAAPPLATFTLPQPIKVSDLPRRQS